MQVYLLALLLGLFVYTSPSEARGATLSAAALMGWYLTPKLALAGLYWLLCIRTRRRLGRGDTPRLMRRFDRATWLYRLLCLKDYALDLWWLGAPDLVRGGIGDLILIDELAILAPPLALAAWSWWAYYPIDRQMRQSTLISRLDAGLPVHPIWTRGQFLASQLRHQVALVMAPMLLILAWEEMVWRWVPAAGPWALPMNLRPLVALVGVAAVLAAAPELIRRVWDTAPMPAGDLRRMLTGLCQRHRVRVRELLLWRTFGGMSNAAVMGFIAPFRYILLTDALLESMPQRQVEAVMAHELAHVRKHHMPWMLASATATWGVLAVAWALAIEFGLSALWPGLPSHLEAMGMASDSAAELPTVVSALGAGVCWVLAFGWISRRLERQADCFAVQHLARQQSMPADLSGGDDMALTGANSALPAGQDSPPAPVASSPAFINAEAVQTMVAALQRVADLNHIAVHRRSWRHGSIAWRQAHLRTLIGAPLTAMPVDRVVRRIHLVTVLALVLLAAAWAWESWPR